MGSFCILAYIALATASLYALKALGRRLERSASSDFIHALRKLPACSRVVGAGA